MIKTLFGATAVLLAFGAGPIVNAAPAKPVTQTICLDVGGQSRPAICRGQSGRLETDYNICTCANAQRVEAPVCAKGERPLPESRAYELARKEAARDGTLVGDRYKGRSMCVKGRND